MKKLMTLVLVIVALACMMPTKAEAAMVYDQTGMKDTATELREWLAEDRWEASVKRTGDSSYYVFASDMDSPLCMECAIRYENGLIVVDWANEIAMAPDGHQTLLATWIDADGEWTITEAGYVYGIEHGIDL